MPATQSKMVAAQKTGDGSTKSTATKKVSKKTLKEAVKSESESDSESDAEQSADSGAEEESEEEDADADDAEESGEENESQSGSEEEEEEEGDSSSVSEESVKEEVPPMKKEKETQAPKKKEKETDAPKKKEKETDAPTNSPIVAGDDVKKEEDASNAEPMEVVADQAKQSDQNDMDVDGAADEAPQVDADMDPKAKLAKLNAEQNEFISYMRDLVTAEEGVSPSDGNYSFLVIKGLRGQWHIVPHTAVKKHECKRDTSMVISLPPREMLAFREKFKNHKVWPSEEFNMLKIIVLKSMVVPPTKKGKKSADEVKSEENTGAVEGYTWWVAIEGCVDQIIKMPPEIVTLCEQAMLKDSYWQNSGVMKRRETKTPDGQHYEFSPKHQDPAWRTVSEKQFLDWKKNGETTNPPKAKRADKPKASTAPEPAAGAASGADSKSVSEQPNTKTPSKGKRKAASEPQEHAEDGEGSGPAPAKKQDKTKKTVPAGGFVIGASSVPEGLQPFWSRPAADVGAWAIGLAQMAVEQGSSIHCVYKPGDPAEKDPQKLFGGFDFYIAPAVNK